MGAIDPFPSSARGAKMAAGSSPYSRRSAMGTVQDILSRKGNAVHSIGSSATVLDAARLMNDLAVGGLVVVEGENAVGMFTERDILRRVVAARLDPATTKVREVMTAPIAVCRPGTSVTECRAVMTGKRIRHLPIVDGKQLLGMITIGDLLAHEIGEHETTIEFLNSYIFGQR
jgi:CBS domain-containing protein